MKTQTVSRRIYIAFAFLLLCTVCCMAGLAGVSYYTMQQVLLSQTSHSQSFVPAKRLAASFERDILNARIHFIYFVTIQKPGSRELGWGRYHNADADLTALTTLVNRQDELQPLREPVAKLRADYEAYDPALHDTLQMVQNGEVKGAHYDAQVKEWAARGAVMVTDAGNVETLAATTSEASTDRMVGSVSEAQKSILLLLACGLDSPEKDEAEPTERLARRAHRRRQRTSHRKGAVGF
jgi:acylphosphatase